MAWLTRGVRHTPAVACVCLLFAGCEAGSSGEADTERAPAASPDGSRHVGIGRRFGLSDRMAYLGLADSLATTPKTSSPFRFTDILEGSGIDFVHVSGMTAERYFPTANGSGVAIFDYDGDGRLDLYFATATLLPLGTAETGPNRLYRNLGDGKFRGRDRGVGPGLRRVLPRDHRRRHRQRRRPGRLPLQLRAERPLPQQRRRHVPRHQPVGRDRRAELVVGRGVPRLRQRRRPRPLRRQLRRLELPRGRPIVCGDAEEGPRSTARPGRSGRPSTSSTATTATDVHRRDRRGRASAAPTATASASSPPTSTATAGSTSTSPTTCTRTSSSSTRATARSRTRPRPRAPPSTTKGGPQSGMGVDAEDVDGDGLPELFVTNFSERVQHALPEPAASGHVPRTSTAALSGWPPTACPGSAGAAPWPTSTTTAGPTASSPTATSTTTASCSARPSTYAEPPAAASATSRPRRARRRFRLATRDAGPVLRLAARRPGRGLRRPRRRRRHRHRRQPQGRPPRPSSATTPRPSNHWIRLNLVGTRSNRDADRRPRRGRRRRPDDLPPAQGGLQPRSRPTTPGS